MGLRHHRARKPRATVLAEALEQRTLLCADPSASGIQLAGHTEPPAGWTVGDKNLLYIHARLALQPAFPDLPGNNLDTRRTTASTVVNAVASYMTEASYGQVSFSSAPETSTTPARLTYVEVTLDQPLSAFPDGDHLATMRERAFEKVRAQGIEPNRTVNPFHFDVIQFSGALTGEPNALGWGNVGKRGAWVRNDDPNLIAHELGHNLGLRHAGKWKPDEAHRDTIIGPGPFIGPNGGMDPRYDAYGNYLDVMGGMANGGHFNVYGKAHVLKWLPVATTITDLEGSNRVDGDYRIFPLDDGNARDPSAPAGSGFDAGKKYGIRIAAHGDSQTYGSAYWVEFRKHANWASNASVMNGVSIIRELTGSLTALLDTTPLTVDAPDTSLTVGRSFTNQTEGFHISRCGKRTGRWWCASASSTARTRRRRSIRSQRARRRRPSTRAFN